MIGNTTKMKLRAGATVYGCFVRSPDATFAEFVATGGWDFLVFDGEHGTVSPRDVADLARACEVRGVTPIARVTANNSSAILRCLDAGAAGLHIPWVNSVTEAEAAIRSMKYWPRGQRGLAGNRSIDWTANLQSTATANAETLSIIHIETAEAADAVADFVKVEDIDVLFIGPTDLSHSLGAAGDPNHPEVKSAIRRVAEAVASSDKALGIYAATPEAVAAGRDLGARYFTTGIEPLLAGAMRTFLDSVRSSEKAK